VEDILGETGLPRRLVARLGPGLGWRVGPFLAARPLLTARSVVAARPILTVAAPAALVVAASLGPRSLQVAVVGRLDVRDVQEAVAADAEIDEGRLNARLNVDDATLVDAADVALVARPLDVKLFQHAVLEDGNAALLRLEDV